MRASCCVSVLPPSSVPGSLHVAEDGAAERDRIDAEVAVEAMILDRDERVLQVGGNVAQRHVLPLLVHPEPAPAVGGEEPRVADAAASAGGPRSPAASIHMTPTAVAIASTTKTTPPRDRERVADQNGHAGGAFATATGARRSCSASDRTM